MLEWNTISVHVFILADNHFITIITHYYQIMCLSITNAQRLTKKY